LYAKLKLSEHALYPLLHDYLLSDEPCGAPCASKVPAHPTAQAGNEAAPDLRFKPDRGVTMRGSMYRGDKRLWSFGVAQPLNARARASSRR
jgi:hypothetical protein